MNAAPFPNSEFCPDTNGLLAAIDLELDRGTSRRVIQIKQSVLAACRIQYLRCPPDQLPSLDELHQLVPRAETSPALIPHRRNGHLSPVRM